MQVWGGKCAAGILGPLACLLTVMTFGAASALAQLVPHRAVYEVHLDENRGGSVMAMTGKLQFEWKDSCDGWLVNQHFIFLVLDRHGNQHWTDRRYITWEAKDGSAFRFSIVTNSGGRRIETVEGDATLRSDGSGGEIYYRLPSRYEAALPAGTTFPAAHFLQALNEMKGTADFKADTVFSGPEGDGLQRVTTFYGLPVTAEPDALGGALTALSGRNLRFAYFPFFGREESPDQEISMRLRSNGVVDSFVMDHIDFSFAGELESWQEVPPQGC